MTFWQLTIDANDPALLARFWGLALGYRPTPPAEPRTTWHAHSRDEIVEAAMNEPDRMPRSLDAIHLATARQLGTDLTSLITYDDRLASAARDAGMTVAGPRD